MDKKGGGGGGMKRLEGVGKVGIVRRGGGLKKVWDKNGGGDGGWEQRKYEGEVGRVEEKEDEWWERRKGG